MQEELSSALQEAKNFRNKYIGHNALNKEQIEDLSWGKIKELIDGICEVMNEICLSCSNHLWCYEMGNMRNKEYSMIRALCSYKLVLNDYFEYKKNPDQKNPLGKYFDFNTDALDDVTS